jgi:RNA polymerase sigma factor (sigma-70 family)
MEQYSPNTGSVCPWPQEDYPAEPARRSRQSPAVLDLLPTIIAPECFAARVRRLALSKALEDKVLAVTGYLPLPSSSSRTGYPSLSHLEEKELATEMLLCRHRFTETVLRSAQFRQATLSILQNIYLFRERRIFFVPDRHSAEREREEALQLFSALPARRTLPLAKTFQHLIVARVWKRICSLVSPEEQQGETFTELHRVVVQLNTIRNIYMAMTLGLIQKLAGGLSWSVKETISYEDAVQIGSIGIARAAYRYHHSSGIRFSTYAAHWIFKEIQGQARESCLIRGPAQGISRTNPTAAQDHSPLATGVALFPSGEQHVSPHYPGMAREIENRQIQDLLLKSVDTVLPGEIGDIIKRRYGLPPYRGKAQSVQAISQVYGKTRSSIYQREKTALKRLKKHLELILA